MTSDKHLLSVREKVVNPAAENYLKKIILPELEKGRPNWDRPHTLGVVRHTKAIITHTPSLKLDPDVLIAAAYAHDWGYAELFAPGIVAGYEVVKNQKKRHMEIGVEKTRVLLSDSRFNYLSLEQKNRIVHLVFVHDKLAELHDPDELVLMEADTLGGLDVSAVTPTFSFEDNQRWEKEAASKRRRLFITDYGKQLFDELLAGRRAYYQSWRPHAPQ